MVAEVPCPILASRGPPQRQVEAAKSSLHDFEVVGDGRECGVSDCSFRQGVLKRELLLHTLVSQSPSSASPAKSFKGSCAHACITPFIEWRARKCNSAHKRATFRNSRFTTPFSKLSIYAPPFLSFQDFTPGSLKTAG